MPETTLYPPPRPLSVGEVLDLSFRIYQRTFVKCLVLGGLIVVVNWLPNLYSIARGQSVVQSVVKPHTDAGHVVALLIALVLAFVFPVALIFRQYNMVTGQATGGEFLRALKRLGRIVLIIILMFLMAAACSLLLIPAFLATGVWRYVLLAVLLLPFGYVFLRLGCTFTAMAIENTGATESLGRSWDLTGGSVLRLTAIYTVALFLLLVLYVAVGAATALLSAVLGKGDVALMAAAVGVMTVVAGALASPYYSALGLAVFGDLLVRKEGADLSQRISAS